jgi:hypothetical protein
MLVTEREAASNSSTSPDWAVWRVFGVPNGDRLHEFRRGSYPAKIYSISFNAASTLGREHRSRRVERDERDRRLVRLDNVGDRKGSGVKQQPNGDRLHEFRRGSYPAKIYSISFNAASTLLCVSSEYPPPPPPTLLASLPFLDKPGVPNRSCSSVPQSGGLSSQCDR